MIKYVKGDATRPIRENVEDIIIAHICNDIGAWGKGFVLAVSNRWPEVESAYRQWYLKRKDVAYNRFTLEGKFQLGACQIVQVAPATYIANMVAQRGLVGPNNPLPIRYTALSAALGQVYKFASLEVDRVVHMPRIGTGLAKGNWTLIEHLIEEELVLKGISVTVYDYEETKKETKK